MSLSSIFKTSTAKDAVTDGAQGDPNKPGVSDFLTVQSFANFAAMSGAITAAWHGAQALLPDAAGLWFPYGCAFLWAVISYLISTDGLAETISDDKKGIKLGTALQALFMAFINAIVLAGSVVGTNTAIRVAGV